MIPTCLMPDNEGNPADGLTVLPFPLWVLPKQLEDFVREASHAIGCPPDYIAVPMLSYLPPRSVQHTGYRSKKAGANGLFSGRRRSVTLDLRNLPRRKRQSSRSCVFKPNCRRNLKRRSLPTAENRGLQTFSSKTLPSGRHNPRRTNLRVRIHEHRNSSRLLQLTPRWKH